MQWSEHYGPVFDDVSGIALDPTLAEKGELEEMETFRKRKVYEYVLRGEAVKNVNGKFVGVRWVRVNKGSEVDPQVRCRLVAQEFARGESRDDLFAGPPRCRR